MSSSKKIILLLQLGSPESPACGHVRKFLRDFLVSRRVVDLNPWIWKFILNFFILPFRTKKSAKLYSLIWENNSFPLIRETEKFAEKVAGQVDTSSLEIRVCFLLSQPTLGDLFQSLVLGAEDELVLIPLFPQYSEAVSALAVDCFNEVISKLTVIPSFRFIMNFHREPAFIQSSCRQIGKYLDKWQQSGERIDHLLISFHGIPWKQVTEKKDIYFDHCMETFDLIKAGSDLSTSISFAFQSRFLNGKWTSPYTQEEMLKLIKQGKKNIAIYCPSFVVDCLETLVEIEHELGNLARSSGGAVYLIPCLNDNDGWCHGFARFLESKVR